jgi:hypothetical protein
MKLRMTLFQSIVTVVVLSWTYCPAFCETPDLPVNCQVIVTLMELDEDATGLDENTYGDDRGRIFNLN